MSAANPYTTGAAASPTMLPSQPYGSTSGPPAAQAAPSQPYGSTSGPPAAQAANTAQPWPPQSTAAPQPPTTTTAAQPWPPVGSNTSATATASYTATTTPSAPPRSTTERLNDILSRFEITIAEANDLVVLEDYEIVVVVDDSGSMNMSSVPASERKLGVPTPTRWDELRGTVMTVAELACIFDEDGIDVYFLNRPDLHNVTHGGDKRLVDAFNTKPRGTTPLTQTVTKVIKEKADCEKPVLVMIATDGEPDGGAAQFAALIAAAIIKFKGKFKFQILACTDDEDSIGWLNELDDLTDSVDVTDDYVSEKQEVLAAGKVSTFARSDWVIKAMLGPILPKFGRLDEPEEEDIAVVCTVTVPVAVVPTVVATPAVATGVPATKQGILEKYSCGNKLSIVKNWKSRHVVCTRTSMSYYKSSTDAEPQGVVKFGPNARLYTSVGPKQHPAANKASEHYFAIENSEGKMILFRTFTENKASWCSFLSGFMRRAN